MFGFNISSLFNAGIEMPTMDKGIKGRPSTGRHPIKPFSVSKYKPHQGEQEKARRVRQMKAGVI